MNKRAAFNLVFIAVAVTLVLSHTEAQTLRSLADARGIKIGVAYKNGGGAGTYNTTLAREFNGLVGENNMKPEGLQSTRGNFTYAGADAMVAFAQQNNMAVRGHVLVWHQQSGFVANLPTQATVKATRDTMFKVMKTHITAVMQHFKGKVNEWDVLNEAVADDSAGLRLGTGNSSSFWALRTDAVNNNWDYIDSAFSFARQADSSALLFYNDYDAENMGKKSDLVYALMTRLKAKNLIDGVGLQCHFYVPGTGTELNGKMVPSEVAANIKRLGDLGLRISLTEIDFRVPTPASAQNLEAQKNAYQTLMGICLANPNCKSFYVWGLNDGSSWIPNRYPGYGAPLLFDDTFKAKPAYDGLIAFLKPTAIRTQRGAGFGLKRQENWNSFFDARGRFRR